MNIETLGNLGEFPSSIGVIATLIFLIVEIRRNTAASRETTEQRATIDNSFDRFIEVLNNEEGRRFVRETRFPEPLKTGRRHVVAMSRSMP